MGHLGIQVGPEHPLFPWLIKWAGDLLTRYVVGESGRSAYEQIKRKASTRALAKFGEKILYMPMKSSANMILPKSIFLPSEEHFASPSLEFKNECAPPITTQPLGPSEVHFLPSKVLFATPTPSLHSLVILLFATPCKIWCAPHITTQHLVSSDVHFPSL